MSRIDSSGIRKVFDLAATMTDPINLSIGQPDFEVPEPVKTGAIEAIREGFNRYTPTQGIPELIEGVRELMRRTRDWDPPGVLITSGVSGGILLSLATLVEAGDEVIFGDPYFVMYKHIVSLMDGVPVTVDTYPDFRLTAERIEAVLTPKSKVLVLNSPCNPTGVVNTASELEEIAELATRHHLTVISDEIYDRFCYDGPFVSIARFMEEVLVLGGFSKSHAMTGWRLGYACGPAEVMAEIAALTPIYGGASFERLEAEGGLQWPVPTPDHPGTPYLHKGRFSRGLGHFTAVEFKEPAEAPDEEYPLTLTTGRIMFHYHTGSLTRRSEKLDQEVREGYVEISPQDADRLGLGKSELVRVISRRGEIETRAWITRRVPPGVVFIPFHFAESAANMLTNAALDPIAKIPEYKVAAVRVEKISPTA